MEMWIGLVHVRPQPTNKLLGDAVGAFVPAVALADNEEDFASIATACLHQQVIFINTIMV